MSKLPRAQADVHSTKYVVKWNGHTFFPVVDLSGPENVIDYHPVLFVTLNTFHVVRGS